MGMMQAIRCKFGQHEWGPYVGAIGETRHECEHCGTVKVVKVKRPPRNPGGSGMNDAGGPGFGPQ